MAKSQPPALPSVQRWEGQPYLHFSGKKSLGFGVSTEIETVTSFKSRNGPLSTPLSDYALCVGLNHKFITK